MALLRMGNTEARSRRWRSELQNILYCAFDTSKSSKRRGESIDGEQERGRGQKMLLLSYFGLSGARLEDNVRVEL